jgi:hypothetical protein
MVHIFARGRPNNILKALGPDWVFLVRQLQEFDFVNHSSSPVGELLSHITALQSGDHVKSVWADHSGYLLDGNVRISAEVGNVPCIVFVRKDKTNRVTVTLQCLIDPANARQKFFARGHVFTVKGGSVLYDT